MMQTNILSTHQIMPVKDFMFFTDDIDFHSLHRKVDELKKEGYVFAESLNEWNLNEYIEAYQQYFKGRVVEKIIESIGWENFDEGRLTITVDSTSVRAVVFYKAQYIQDEVQKAKEAGDDKK